MAVQVKQIEKGNFFDFQKGSFLNVSLNSEGKLFLGPKTRKISGPSEEYYFSAVLGRNGDLFLGTGHKASVFKISENGIITKIFEGNELDVYALTQLANGDLAVGTSPNGRVYRIASDNKVSEIFNPEEKFIWDIKEDRQGNVICALGNSGAIYSIRKSGEAENIIAADDSHIVSIHVSDDNSLLAGSGDRGIVYQIKNKKTKVLFDSPLEEIKGITEDDEGNIYFVAVKGTMAPKVSKEIESGVLAPKSLTEEKPEAKEKSILYCLQKDGSVEKLWSSDEEFAYSLLYSKDLRAVVIGTGNGGRVYQVKTDGSHTLMLENESAQVFKIVPSKRGFLAVTDNAAQLIEVETNMASNGSYISEIFDVKMPAKFGRLSWLAELPKQVGISFFVRMGNSDNPDKSWTSWSAPFSDPENSYLNLSGYRFFQIKIVFNSASPGLTPLLDYFRMYYLENNLKPVLKDIRVLKPVEKKPAEESKTSLPKKYLQVKWQADDPNQDQLNYSIYIKKVSGKEWQVVKKNFQEKEFYLDTEIFEDGKYHLKVVADDSLDNPPNQFKTSEAISSQFRIDSTAPVVKDLTVTGKTIRFAVSDETSDVAQVLFSTDGKLWAPLFPIDGINDSKMENFNLDLSVLKGSANLLLKVIDEYNNQKVFQREI